MQVNAALLLLVFLAWGFSSVWLSSYLHRGRDEGLMGHLASTSSSSDTRVEISLVSPGKAAARGSAALTGTEGRAALSSSQSDGATGKTKITAFIGVQTGFSSSWSSGTIPNKYNYELRRNVLRRTWFPGNETEMERLEAQYGYVMRFVIGQTSNGTLEARLQREIDKYGPMLRLDVMESYAKLSWKSQSFFVNVYERYDVDYIVKIDDDVYLRPDRLMAAITQYKHRQLDYIGCMKRGNIVKDPRLKWFEPQHALLGDGNYFSHAFGPMYIMSGRAAGILANHEPDMLRHFMNEDMTIGGWMLLFNVKEYDDRRLCTRSCTPLTIGSYPMPTCQGLCNPVVDMLKWHNNPNCSTPTLPGLRTSLPLLRPAVKLNDDDFKFYILS